MLHLIPPELVVKILDYSKTKELVSLTMTCNYLHQIVEATISKKVTLFESTECFFIKLFSQILVRKAQRFRVKPFVIVLDDINNNYDFKLFRL